MSDPIAELKLTIQASSALDQNELDDWTQRLQDEISQLEVQAVHLVKAPPPSKEAMPIDLIMVGSLAVQLAPVVVPALASLLKTWLETRQPQSPTKDELTLLIQMGNFRLAFNRTTTPREIAQLEDKARQMAHKKK